MAKLRKYQLVEMYLSKLVQRDDFGLKELEALNHKDICNAVELDGIGDRTISNTLAAFKLKKGIELPKQKVTKKQKVENYLQGLLDNEQISQEELHELNYFALKDAEELAGVGKTTITCAIAEFKQNNGKDAFEAGVLDFLTQEKLNGEAELDVVEPEEASVTAEVIDRVIPMNTIDSFFKEFGLDNANIKLVKKMINEFKQLKDSDEEKKLYELRELKHALHFVGINPKKIIRLYWEDISKDFMQRKILSGKERMSTDIRVGGLV